MRWALGKAWIRTRQGKWGNGIPVKELVKAGVEAEMSFLHGAPRQPYWRAVSEGAVQGKRRWVFWVWPGQALVASLMVCSMCCGNLGDVRAEDLELGNLKCLLIQNTLSRKLWDILLLWHGILCYVEGSDIPLGPMFTRKLWAFIFSNTWFSAPHTTLSLDISQDSGF